MWKFTVFVVRASSPLLGQLGSKMLPLQIIFAQLGCSPEIKDDDLIDRTDSILILEAVSGTLNNLTPEQIAVFDEAVEGK
jgi:hypothetical protein